MIIPFFTLFVKTFNGIYGYFFKMELISEKSREYSKRRMNMRIDDIKKIEFDGTIEETEKILKDIFSKDDTFKLRSIISGDGKRRFCICFCDGMINQTLISENIVYPLKQCDEPDIGIERVAFEIITIDEVSVVSELSQAIQSMLYGDTLIFVEGSTSIVVASTKGYKMRGVQEPEGEKLVRGPREGFTESIMTNTSLIRRKLYTPDLKFDMHVVGQRSMQRYAVCYLDGLVNREVLRKVYKRLKDINIDAALDTNYLEELISDSRYSPFKTIGSTEKPDIAVAKLLEGKVLILLDGTPTVLTVPFLFLEYFQSGNDYYVNFFYGSITRILRIIGFALTISSPALYVAIIMYHHEILPINLLMSIASAREGVPFSTLLEILLMMLAYELLREAGVMMPNSIGDALSTVGGVVIGQAAVDAKIVSAPVVIVVALAGLTGLMIPKMKGPMILLRLFYIFMAAVLGIYGLSFGICVTMIYLIKLDSFGIPYMSYIVTASLSDMKDTLYRAPWKLMVYRPVRTMNKDRKRTLQK